MPRGDAGAFIAEHNTAPSGRLPLNTLLPAFRHVRDVRIAGERAPDARHPPAQIPGAKISVCHGVGGMFAASGTIIMSNEPP